MIYKRTIAVRPGEEQIDIPFTQKEIEERQAEELESVREAEEREQNKKPAPDIIFKALAKAAYGDTTELDAIKDKIVK